MYHIPNKVDFYITNVCNLTCEGCNRFNNYNFRGWQRWSDYKADYERWGKLVSLKAATIMGGEPFLNPTLIDWVQGINQIFGIEVQVLTNGTRFEYAKDLYNAMLYKSDVTGAQNHIGVSLHNADQKDRLDADIRNFLQDKVTCYPRGHPGNRFNSDWMYFDKNNVLINVYLVDTFTDSTIIPPTFRLHNSNVQRAHDNCVFVKFKSYHFIKGKLYKCAPVALLPEFNQQHPLDISEDDISLLNSYVPLSTENFETYHREFFKNLDNPIPQCKFCPELHTFKKIYPIRKGTINV